ncbi:hypothetical protein T06_8726, partial [Trichinella sp. T6]
MKICIFPQATPKAFYLHLPPYFSNTPLNVNTPHICLSALCALHYNPLTLLTTYSTIC